MNLILCLWSVIEIHGPFLGPHVDFLCGIDDVEALDVGAPRAYAPGFPQASPPPDHMRNVENPF